MMPQFTYSSSELDALSEARNYYSWLVGQFAPFLGGHIIEVGAGVGTFSQYLLAAAPVRLLEAIEPAVNNAERLSETFRNDSRVEVHHGYLEGMELAGVADAVVMVNVLEHIADDRAALSAAYQALRPGGHLLLFVPAVQAIYGSLDRAFEHYRRYERSGFRALVGEVGYDVRRLRYVNSFGVIAWYLSGRVFRRRSLDRHSVRLYDRLVVPWLFGCENVMPPFIGQSLLVVARRGER